MTQTSNLGLKIVEAAVNSKIEQAATEIISKPSQWKSFSSNEKWKVVGFIALGAAALVTVYICADKIIDMYN